MVVYCTARQHLTDFFVQSSIRVKHSSRSEVEHRHNDDMKFDIFRTGYIMHGLDCVPKTRFVSKKEVVDKIINKNFYYVDNSNILIKDLKKDFRYVPVIIDGEYLGIFDHYNTKK